MAKDYDVLLEVSGMSCNHCVNAVKNAIQSVSGVADVDVSLDENRAYVKGAVPKDALINAVEEAGFQAR